MEEQIISFETAKLANKKRFDWWAKDRYNRKGLFNESKAWSVSAPTQALLQKWLREEHKLWVDVGIKERYETTTINFEIWSVEENDWIANHDWFNTTFQSYEEALEQGLKTALELI